MCDAPLSDADRSQLQSVVDAALTLHDDIGPSRNGAGQVQGASLRESLRTLTENLQRTEPLRDRLPAGIRADLTAIAKIVRKARTECPGMLDVYNLLVNSDLIGPTDRLWKALVRSKPENQDLLARADEPDQDIKVFYKRVADVRDWLEARLIESPQAGGKILPYDRLHHLADRFSALWFDCTFKGLANSLDEERAEELRALWRLLGWNDMRTIEFVAQNPSILSVHQPLPDSLSSDPTMVQRVKSALRLLSLPPDELPDKSESPPDLDSWLHEKGLPRDSSMLGRNGKNDPPSWLPLNWNSPFWPIQSNAEAVMQWLERAAFYCDFYLNMFPQERNQCQLRPRWIDDAYALVEVLKRELQLTSEPEKPAGDVTWSEQADQLRRLRGWLERQVSIENATTNAEIVSELLARIQQELDQLRADPTIEAVQGMRRRVDQLAAIAGRTTDLALDDAIDPLRRAFEGIQSLRIKTLIDEIADAMDKIARDLGCPAQWGAVIEELRSNEQRKLDRRVSHNGLDGPSTGPKFVRVLTHQSRPGQLDWREVRLDDCTHYGRVGAVKEEMHFGTVQNAEIYRTSDGYWFFVDTNRGEGHYQSLEQAADLFRGAGRALPHELGDVPTTTTTTAEPLSIPATQSAPKRPANKKNRGRPVDPLNDQRANFVDENRDMIGKWTWEQFVKDYKEKFPEDTEVTADKMRQASNRRNEK